MAVVHLTDRSLVAVTGPEARDFLQNLVTTDLASLVAGEVRPGALLTPQGKIMFDFLVSAPAPDTLVLECRADIADDFVRRLALYRLRAKVQIAKQDQGLVAVAFADDSAGSTDESPASRDESAASGIDSGWFHDTRFPAPAIVRRSYGQAPAASAGTNDWTAFRIAHGIAESGADYALGDAFPHDVLLDQTGGVGFRKGCYVGQEVVSRMHHRGTARRRVLIASSDGALPTSGADITADGRVVGTLGTTLGSTGIAVARIDKVKAAIDAGTPLLAAGVALRLAIPGFATFGFPETVAADEA